MDIDGLSSIRLHRQQNELGRPHAGRADSPPRRGRLDPLYKKPWTHMERVTWMMAPQGAFDRELLHEFFSGMEQ